jgi:tRNA threonylcarbamoyladenosine biosynthesis protein TsaB
MILGVDTSTPATVVGLMLDDGSVMDASDHRAPGDRPGHQQGLLELAAALLARAGAGWSELDRVAVGIGPGGYTGLRVGIASARGLAQALGAEIVGVSSLMALAHGVPRVEDNEPVDGVLTIVDARRGEVFAAAYRLPTRAEASQAPHGEPGRGWEPPVQLGAPRAVAPEHILDVPRQASVAPAEPAAAHGAGEPHPDAGPGRWLAVGNGAAMVRSELVGAGIAVPPQESPAHKLSAAALCDLGARAAPQEIEQVLPEYCRRPDAEIALEDGRLAHAGGRAGLDAARRHGPATAAQQGEPGRAPSGAGVSGVRG